MFTFYIGAGLSRQIEFVLHSTRLGESLFMNLSGIVVAVPTENIDGCVERLNAMTGVEVHNVEREKGRIVVVQEAETIADEVEGLKAIKALPGVTFAEMVYHYFAEDEQFVEAIPEDLDEMTGLPAQQVCVPAYLQD